MKSILFLFCISLACAYASDCTWKTTPRVLPMPPYSYPSVASLTYSGSTILAGAPLDSLQGQIYNGEAIIYDENFEGDWFNYTLTQDVILPGWSYVGRGVSISANGQVAVVTSVPTVYIYTRWTKSHYSWTLHQQIPTSIASTYYTAIPQLSDNGSVLLVWNEQSVRIYRFDSSTLKWEQEGEFGACISAALSGDGFSMLIGRASYQVDVYHYLPSVSKWMPLQNWTIPSGDSYSFGYSVALNFDGTVAAVSAIDQNSYGYVYVFYPLIPAKTHQLGMEAKTVMWGNISIPSPLQQSPIQPIHFGYSVSLSSSGHVLSVMNYLDSGYIYELDRTTNSAGEYQSVKASLMQTIEASYFGTLSGDGKSLVVARMRDYIELFRCM